MFSFELASNFGFWLGWKQDPSCRESDYRAYWLARNHRILDLLLQERSSIICLQVCICLSMWARDSNRFGSRFYEFLRLTFANMWIMCICNIFRLVYGFAQEFWVGNEELVNLYERRLGHAGYVLFKLGRTNNRGDGMIFHSNFGFIKVLLGLN